MMEDKNAQHWCVVNVLEVAINPQLITSGVLHIRKPPAFEPKVHKRGGFLLWGAFLSHLRCFSPKSQSDTEYRFLVVPLPHVHVSFHYGRSRSGWSASTSQIDLKFIFWLHFGAIQNIYKKSIPSVLPREIYSRMS